MTILAFIRAAWATKIGKGVIIAAVLIVAFVIWLKVHDRGVVKRHTAEQQTKAIDANEKADKAREETTQIIANDTQEVKDALDKLPDAPLTDRQRARFCAVWVRQHGTDCPATR